MRIRFACPLDCASKHPYQPTVVMFFCIAINISAPHHYKRFFTLFNAIVYVRALLKIILLVCNHRFQFVYLPVLNRVYNYKSPQEHRKHDVQIEVNVIIRNLYGPVYWGLAVRAFECSKYFIMHDVSPLVLTIQSVVVSLL